MSTDSGGGIERAIGRFLAGAQAARDLSGDARQRALRDAAHALREAPDWTDAIDRFLGELASSPCDEVQEALLDALDPLTGNLPADLTLEAPYAEHLDTCPSCRAFREQIGWLDADAAEQEAIASALEGFLSTSPQKPPKELPFVLEIARGAAHVAQFVRSFLAGQTPPAFQLSPATLQALGKTTDPPTDVLIGQAGPVAIAVMDDPTRDAVIITLRLSGPAAGPAVVRLYRGWEGAASPPALLTTFALSPDQPQATQRFSRAAFTAVRIEVEPAA